GEDGKSALASPQVTRHDAHSFSPDEVDYHLRLPCVAAARQFGHAALLKPPAARRRCAWFHDLGAKRANTRLFAPRSWKTLGGERRAESGERRAESGERRAESGGRGGG